MTIAKICDILTWQNEQLGFLDKDGFQVPVRINENLQGESITISEDELNQLSVEEQKVNI